jgi:hypothetical protein
MNIKCPTTEELSLVLEPWSYDRQHLGRNIAEVLKRMHGAAGRESGTACTEHDPLAVDLCDDLAAQNVKPFILTGVAVQRRSGHRRHGQMENRGCAVAVGVG